MKRAEITRLVLLVLALHAVFAFALPAFSQPESAVDKADVEAPVIGLWSRLDYLRREDATQTEDYARIGLGYDTEKKFFHPCGGLEMRVDDSRVRAFWVGDDIRITPHFKVHLRLNHTEFYDWKTAINYINAYYSYQRWWIRLAAGWGYAALIFEENDYQNPFTYGSEAPETRFIYNLSLRPSFWKGRIEVDAGLRNFDNFEYHGFDDNGFHVEPIIHVTKNTSVSYFYERRYTAAFVNVPTLARTTWMVSIEHRFN